jgi:hypothetical protein
MGHGRRFTYSGSKRATDFQEEVILAAAQLQSLRSEKMSPGLGCYCICGWWPERIVNGLEKYFGITTDRTWVRG